MPFRQFIPILILMLASCSPGGANPGAADPKFGKAVHDYLVANPEILEEMQAALTAKRERVVFQEAIKDKDDPFIGRKDAKVTIIEFFDYRCPYCMHSMEWVLKQPSKNKDVRVVFKEMPFLTPGSYEGAQAALAANKQGKYAAMHRALMTSTGDLTSEVIDKAARSAGVDVKRMRRDMTSPEIVEHIKRVGKLSSKAKVESTPTFLVNGILVTGYDEKALDAAIAKAMGENQS